ncbi:MAG: TonB-dependent receptor [Candidatus Edwardsbacteria bacterium]|nr:TonB-dependent receptor [Candidatus Edwardsbacteria bacterium]
MKLLRLFIAVVVCLGLSGAVALAGTTGKIAGTVIDADTKEPLPGAVVTILGTALGANTDLDGRYMIINVAVGTYSVQAKMMGYSASTMTNVKSIMDLTTTINFKLSQKIYERGEIVIEAQRKLVIADATAKTTVMSTDEIMSLPGGTANSAIGQTAGIVVQANGDMNVRGGRSDEMAYFIDNVVVNDPLQGLVGAQINTGAIQEIMVITGGFNAEYGEAMSGVVNVVTKEGGEKFSLYTRYTTDIFLGRTSRDYNRFEANFGGPIPYAPNFFYFLSGEYTNYAGPASFMPEKYYVHDPSRDQFSYWADTLRINGASWDSVVHRYAGQWMDSTNEKWETEKNNRLKDPKNTLKGWKEYDKIYLPNRPFNSYRVQGKLTYKINPWNAKFTLGSFANRDQYGAYSYTYKYNLGGLPYRMTKSFQINGTWRHQIGNKTFYTLIANYFDTKYQYGNIDTVYEKTRKFWQDYKILSDDDLNYDGIYDAYDKQQPDFNLPDNPYGFSPNVSMLFFSRGLYRVWERTEASYNALKFDITSQVNKVNQIQSGLEAKQHRCYRKYNSLPWDADPFKDGYLFRPRTAAWYLQDKIEFEQFIINAGLRVDYLHSQAEYWKDQFDSSGGWVWPKAKWQLSPRLGISHPVTERTVFHLSYGHFFQQPQFQYLFESLMADVVRRGNSVVGNPELSAQKNIAYEAGIAHQFTDNLAADFTLYYKDIFNLLGGTTLKDSVHGTGTDYYGYTNSEYGNVRGVEVSFQKRSAPGSIFSGRTSYSFQIAKGSASDPFEAYWNWRGNDPATGEQLQPPRVDNSLTFDQRHTFSVSTDFDFDKEFGPKLWDVRPLANVSISFLNNIGSGFPYSRKDRRGDVIGEYNGFRTPWTWNTDLLASKTFSVSKFNFSLNFEMFNVFNRKNVEGVFPVTGKEDNDGSLLTIDQAFPGKDSIPRYRPVYVDSSNRTDTLYVPNTYYSPNADLNHDGAIDRYEKYAAYRLAWEDIVNDPINGARDPSSKNYEGPRTMRLSLSFKF